MNAILKANSAEIRNRLAKEGFNLCKCSRYDGMVWLEFTSDCYFEIHGVNKVSGDVKCFDTDIEGFINFCKENKINHCL